MEIMEQSFLMTTSPNFEGSPIEEYLGVVASNVVTGTGLFSDIAAAFSDFFGGRSTSYKRQLESIRTEAMKEVESKARALGANAVVSLTVDNDQISGKSTQMLMISITATAVKLSELDKVAHSSPETSQSKLLSHSEIEFLFRLNEMKEKSNDMALGQMFDDFKDIFEHRPSKSVAKVLLKRFLSLPNSVSAYDNDLARTLSYLSYFNSEDLEEIIYPEASKLDDSKHSIDLLLTVAKNLSVFSNKEIVRALDSNINSEAVSALALCRSDKAAYRREDIKGFEAIIDKIETRFPIIRQVAEKKKSFGRASRVWECINGHENAEEMNNCPQCDLSRRDLPRNLYENALISLRNKIKKLEVAF